MFYCNLSINRLSSLLEAAHNGPLPSQTAGAHHEIGDNKAPGGPTSLTSGVSSGVSSTFHAYEDPPGLHEKVLCWETNCVIKWIVIFPETKSILVKSN